jgi:very-short-patch-repair endonuclease
LGGIAPGEETGMGFWRGGEPDLDLWLPAGWQWQRGPQVTVGIVTTRDFQPVLARLRDQLLLRGGTLPIAAFPEPDNPHDANAVAVLAGGHVIGYLSSAFARLWQPVVLAEHAAGRVVGGKGTLIGAEDKVRVKGWLTQPAPALPGSPCGEPPLPSGIAGRAEFWSPRELTRRLRREHEAVKGSARRAQATRYRQEDQAWNRVNGWNRWNARRATVWTRYLAARAQARRGTPEQWHRRMSPTEQRLNHYLAQCPEPFVFEPQVPIGYWRVDFLCEHASLVVEVDGPEHAQAARRLADAARQDQLAALGLVIVRVTNEQVLADPAGVAAQIFEYACRRLDVLPPVDPGSAFHGWVPLAPLIPSPA